MNTNEAARAYAARGWKPVPLLPGEKKITLSKWTSRTFDPDEDFTPENGVGIHLGPSGLMVADLDCDAARALADLAMPRTWTSGRHPVAAHYLFQVAKPGNKLVLTISDPDLQKRLGLQPGTDNKAALVELLGRGQQIAVAPTKLADGTSYKWHCDDVAIFESDRDDLVERCGRLAFYALVAMAWPKAPGFRDEAALALSGTLVRLGIPAERADYITERICEFAGDEEAAKRGKADQTIEKQEAGEQFTALSRLIELLDLGAAEKDIRKWLKVDAVAKTDQWPGGVIQSTGEPRKCHLNTVAALGDTRIRKNVFTAKPEVTVAEGGVIPPHDGPVTDDVVLLLADAIAVRHFDPGIPGIHRAVKTLAARNPYHPVQEYLESLPPWDGKRRIHDHLIRHFGANRGGKRVKVEGWPILDRRGEDIGWTYVEWVSTMHYVAMVARAFEPGVKYDHALVLEGTGNSGKSTYCRKMAIRPGWFNDQTFLGKDDKTQAELIRGRTVCELQELAGLNAAKPESDKAAISRTSDNVRAAYGEYVEDNPRSCVFIATTELGTYLKKIGTNRRWLPIRVNGVLAFDDLEAEIPMLFAECLHLYREGFKLYLPREVYELATEQQLERVQDEDWEDVLVDIGSRCTEEEKRAADGVVVKALRISSKELHAYVSEQCPGYYGRQDPYRILREAMEKRGWEKATMKIGGTPTKGFEKLKAQYELDLEAEVTAAEESGNQAVTG